MKKILIFLTLLIISLTALLYILDSSETEENYYQNKEEALNDQAILRGWLPQVIPDSAFDIYETHRIDENYVTGNFQYQEKDEKTFLKQLKIKNKKFVWKDFIFEVNTSKNSVKFYYLEDRNRT